MNHSKTIKFRKSKPSRTNKKHRHTTRDTLLLAKRRQRRKLRKSVDTCVSRYEERLSTAVLVANGASIPTTAIPCPPQVTNDYPISSGKLESSAGQRKRNRAKILRDVRTRNRTETPARINMKRFNSVTGIPNPVGSGNTKNKQPLPEKKHMAYDEYLAKVVKPNTVKGRKVPKDPVKIDRVNPDRIVQRLARKTAKAIARAARVNAKLLARGKSIE